MWRPRAHNVSHLNIQVYNVLITTQWENPSFSPVARAATIDLGAKIRSAAGVTEETSYPNYADVVAGENLTDKHAKVAFGANYERMREVKGVYDPQGVFNGWFAIPPVL